MEHRRPSGTPPRFGESEAFDRIAQRVRVAAWWIILPALGFRSTVASKLLDDIPTVLVRDGIVNEKAMARERLDTDDILEAARRQMGLERFDQVRFAILERTGGISVIPWPPADATPRAR